MGSGYIDLFPLFFLLIAIVGYYRMSATTQETLDAIAVIKTDIQTLKDKVAALQAAGVIVPDEVTAALADLHATATS